MGNRLARLARGKATRRVIYERLRTLIDDFLEACIEDMLLVSRSAIAENSYKITANPAIPGQDLFIPYRRFTKRFRWNELPPITSRNILPGEPTGDIKLVFFATTQHDRLIWEGLSPAFQHPDSNRYLVSTDPEILKNLLGYDSPYKVFILATTTKLIPDPDVQHKWWIPGDKYKKTLVLASVVFTSPS